jgi:3-oxoacyl-[acyl-carrier protein] reductase
MKQRVILITGANGGLGQAIAREFLAEHEANQIWLAVRARRNHADCLIAENPGRCRCLTLDVTSPEAWSEGVARILAESGRLDVLVNNAGVHEDALLGVMPRMAWERVLASNLDGVFHGCQAALPSMISQRFGRIINIASLSALLAPAGQANYAAAKAGVIALTQSLAKEVARIGITVNAICPGYIDTEALHDLDPEKRGALMKQIPMRRFGRPEEVAAAVRFFACDAASYITGSTLKIDGGIL